MLSRHDTHARYVTASLANHKPVFVEKPLAITREQLDEIQAAVDKEKQHGLAPFVMVGFNRRFAPMVVKMRELLAATAGPKSFVMTVNAGAIPAEHWTQDPDAGGGRIVGEACHFIDLLRHLAGAPVVSFDVTGMARAGGPPRTDVASLTLRFEDGSFGVVNYLANGHKAYPKERLEAFAGGRVLVLDNYRKLSGYGWPGFGGLSAWSQDKGQTACVAAFVAAVKRGGLAPIAPAEIFEVSRLAIEAAQRAG